MQKYQSDNGKSERDSEDGTAVPGFTPELGSRISAIVDMIGSQKAAAEIAEVSPEQVGRWATGRSKMSLAAATKLSDAAKVNIAWLATGQEPMRPQTLEKPAGGAADQLDERLLEGCLLAVEEAFGGDSSVTAARKASLVKRLYHHCRERGLHPDDTHEVAKAS